jgi:predicted hydrocarbon binding protein
MEQAARAAGAMLQSMMIGVGMLSKAFYEKYGEEALPIITDVMSRGGANIGKLMQQMRPVKNMNDIAEGFRMMAPVMGGIMQVVESSDDAFRIKLSRCPLGIEGTSRELCEALMSMDENIVGAALGQEVEMKIVKSVAVGDKECEITYSRK